MTTPLKIDFVSDIACPWCAVGLASLQRALAQSADAVQATLHFQPFELNPDMAPGGGGDSAVAINTEAAGACPVCAASEKDLKYEYRTQRTQRLRRGR